MPERGDRVADVAEFRVPDDVTIGYLFYPFVNETLDAAIRGIIESIDRHPRRVRLIYVWPPPTALSMILATKRFRLLTEQSTRLLSRRADRVPTSERVAIFESC